MNKSYKLIDKKKNKDRVLDSIKHDIRKYIKREKNKPLDKGVDFWKMECKLSKDDEELTYVEFTSLMKTFDELTTTALTQINVEILSTKGIKVKREISDEVKEEVKENEEEINTGNI